MNAGVCFVFIILIFFRKKMAATVYLHTLILSINVLDYSSHTSSLATVRIRD
jgi:hypothetical protein